MYEETPQRHPLDWPEACRKLCALLEGRDGGV